MWTSLLARRDRVRTLKHSILIALTVIAAGAGCSREPAVARRYMPPASSAEPMWGETAEGLQCRARPVKRRYAVGDGPTFTIDLRNRGGRIFAFRSGGPAPLSEYSIDGRWRPWPASSPAAGKVRPLGPGAEITDMPATLPPEARAVLTPGPHTIRLAFSLEGVAVVSNPVEIEIAGPR